jgi:uncharacterized protein (TIGR03435 family)
MNVVTLGAIATLNSLWQGLALALLVWLALRQLSRVNAATRHLIWWIALAAVLVLPVIPRRTTITLPATPVAAPAPPRVAALPIPVAPPYAAPPPETPVTITGKRSTIWPYCLLAAWALVFAHRLSKIVRSYLLLRAAKRRGAEWSRPLPGTTRRAGLLISREVRSPIAVGFLHPAVILPEGLREQLSHSELNCVLLHEAAHLARYDDWTNLLARLLDAALALHPVPWWVLRQIEREREMACDDWVVSRTGSPRSYAESLARIVELRIAPATSVLASGIFTRQSRLLGRIEMLLRRGREFSAAAARIPVAGAAVLLAVLAVAGAVTPHWIAFAQRVEFEVASLKLNGDATGKSGEMDGFPRRSGDLVMMHNSQPYSMIYYAYHLHGAYQMVDYKRLPDGWNWYDLDARAGKGATEDQVRLMMQSLLEDRFKLKVHRETREIPEFELTVAKGKSKMTPSRDGPMTVKIQEGERTQSLTTPPGRCGTSGWKEGDHMICHAATMDTFLIEIGARLGAPVVDRTGLTGTYDLNVLFMPDERKTDPDYVLVPAFPEALQETLGLKLEKGKGPVEVLVIDHMEKPSENQ